MAFLPHFQTIKKWDPAGKPTLFCKPVHAEAMPPKGVVRGFFDGKIRMPEIGLEKVENIEAVFLFEGKK